MLFVIAALFMLTACETEQDKEILQLGEDYFEYPQENIYTFYVDDAGLLYYGALEKADSVLHGINGNNQEVITYDDILYAVDGSGNIVNSYNIENFSLGHPFIVVQEYVYYLSAVTTETGLEVLELYEYDMQNGLSRSIIQFSDFIDVRQLEVVDGSIYYLDVNVARVNKEYTLADDNDDYKYEGEILGVVDIATGTSKELAIEFPVCFSKTWNNNLMIYAYDSQKGYHFIEYFIKDESFSEKIYHNLGKMMEFDIYNSEKDFIFTTLNTSLYSLSAASIDSEKGIIEIMPDVLTFFANDIICRGGYTFYYNRKTNYVERIKNSAYIHGNHTIQMISTLNSFYYPFGCGYTIKSKYMDRESFVLSVLSQDRDFDLCFMNSRQDISYNIRDNGSFYPLNDVEGVIDYLEACFPYVKDAATTTDGDIWMLPLSIDIPCFLYNETECQEYGIDLSGSIDLKHFINIIDSLQKEAVEKDKYSISGFLLTENILYQYMQSNNSFANEEFKKLALFLKNNINYIQENEKWKYSPSVYNMLARGESNSFLFDFELEQRSQIRLADVKDIRAGGMPNIINDKSNIATCIYLCVNPASKNLKETLNYISSLCKYLIQQKDVLIFRRRDIYPETLFYNDLYHIYENAKIQFTLPYELFVKDYEAYLRDEAELQNLITEAERKVHIYINE